MNDQFEKRKIISSFLLTVLIGHGFKGMIDSVQNQILIDGLTIHYSFLGLSFFFLAIRFFVGNQLHLFNNSNKTPGFIWLSDLLVIIIESIILILLGNTCIINRSIDVSLGFKELLIILLSIDIFWVIIQNTII